MNQNTMTTLDTVFEIAPADIIETPTPESLAVSSPTPTALVPVEEAPPSEDEQRAQEDFLFSRGAIKSVAVESQSVMHRAIDVATQTDSPRSFEVVAQLVRATLDAHKELQALHQTAAQIRVATASAKTPPGTVNIQQGVVFSGTGEDLLRLISKDRQ